VPLLANNSFLKVLSIDEVDVSLSMQHALTKNLLCDKTSIESIFQSNHCLTDLSCHSFTKYSSELVSLLDLNKCEDKAEVVWKKIMYVLSLTMALSAGFLLQ